MFTGLSRDYPGTVPAFSWDFLGILLCVSLFPQEESETHKQFDPHPFPGQSRETVYVYCFFCPRTIECAQKVGLVWSVPVPSKENDTAWTNGGGKHIIGGGGFKTGFEEGFYGMLSPLLSFPPPFVSLWRIAKMQVHDELMLRTHQIRANPENSI